MNEVKGRKVVAKFATIKSGAKAPSQSQGQGLPAYSRSDWGSEEDG